MDELLSRIHIKLWKSLKLYSADRGTALSFCAKVISSTAASIVGEAWARSERFTELDEENCSYLSAADFVSSEAIADIESKIRGIKTPCTDCYERQAQQWLVESLIDQGDIAKFSEKLTPIKEYIAGLRLCPPPKPPWAVVIYCAYWGGSCGGVKRQNASTMRVESSRFSEPSTSRTNSISSLRNTKQVPNCKC
jgi:hypothetical protein